MGATIGCNVAPVGNQSGGPIRPHDARVVGLGRPTDDDDNCSLAYYNRAGFLLYVFEHFVAAGLRRIGPGDGYSPDCEPRVGVPAPYGGGGSGGGGTIAVTAVQPASVCVEVVCCMRAVGRWRPELWRLPILFSQARDGGCMANALVCFVRCGRHCAHAIADLFGHRGMQQHNVDLRLPFRSRYLEFVGPYHQYLRGPWVVFLGYIGAGSVGLRTGISRLEASSLYQRAACWRGSGTHMLVDGGFALSVADFG